jgi:hypothetical protein
MNSTPTALPPNIQEFNVIAGLIFNQLYKVFPVIVDRIDREAIAQAFGVQGSDWSAHKLPSGRSFSEMLSYTGGWLVQEEYIKSFGAHPSERVILSTKGLIAMNAVPTGLKGPLGTELSKAADGPNVNTSAIGDFIGGLFGGFTKSMAT